jgi:hypothetical protein
VFFVLLVVPLIINGYPVVFPDSGVYLHSYINITSLLSPPLDRPIFYSLFVYISSIARTSIQFVAIAQDALFAFLIAELFYGVKYSFSAPYIALVCYIPISYGAVLSNTIAADIWLGMAYVSIYLLMTRKTRRILSVSLIICACTLFAPANGIILLLSIVLTTPFFMFRNIIAENKITPIVMITLPIVIGLLGDSLDNYYAYKIFSPIADSNTFFVARLTADHLAQNSVNELCRKDQYSGLAACINRQQYLNRTSQQFLWHPYKNGFFIWSLQNQHFFKEVKDRTLSRHLTTFLRMILENSLETLDKYPMNMTELYHQFNKSSDQWICRGFNCKYMMTSWQQEDKNSFDYFKMTNVLLFVLLGYTMIAFRKSIFNDGHKFSQLSIFTASCIIFNAVVDGGLSIPNARYNIKGTGVIVVLYCFIVASMYMSKNIIEQKTIMIKHTTNN